MPDPPASRPSAYTPTDERVEKGARAWHAYDMEHDPAAPTLEEWEREYGPAYDRGVVRAVLSAAAPCSPLVEALTFYADMDNYRLRGDEVEGPRPSRMTDDYGDRAREALARFSGEES